MAPSESDDELQLSSEALEALNSFLSERDERHQRFEQLKIAAEKERDERARPIAMDAFEEDWQQSQFWYEPGTAEALAEEILEGATEQTMVGIISAPSVFVKIQELKAAGRAPKGIKVHLLEYDERFSLFEEFVYYDFQQPLRLPSELKGKFDRVLVDPPFLSNDCQTKAALTARWLTKPWTATHSSPSGHNRDCSASETPAPVRIIVSTGERMQTLVERLYRQAGVRATTFEIRHSNGLGNEFKCYSSFESKRINWEHGDHYVEG